MIHLKQAPFNRHYNVLDEIFSSLPQTWGTDNKREVPVAPANITESANGFNLELLLPGRNMEDFKVSIDKGLLTISYEKKNETPGSDARTIRQEFTLNSFKRSFTIDDKINADAIEAKYENGILRFFLPKKEEVKITPKEINIL